MIVASYLRQLKLEKNTGVPVVIKCFLQKEYYDTKKEFGKANFIQAIYAILATKNITEMIILMGFVKVI